MGTHNKPEACAKVMARIASQVDPHACPGCGENPCREEAPHWRYETFTDGRGVRDRRRTDIRTGRVEVLIRDYKRVAALDAKPESEGI